MVFQPRVEEELHLHGITYTIGEHPVAPHVPYGQEGRQGIVYQLIPRKETASSWKALKVFRHQYKDPKQVYLSEQIRDFATLPGLSVCDRVILTPQQHGELLSKHRDLMYGVVMPWIEGPTWMDVILDKRALTRADSLTLARSLAKVLSTMEQQGLAHCDLSGPNLILPRLVKDSIEDGFSYVELVDVEQLYGPRLERPDVLFAASPGYSPPQASQSGLWSKYADRFSGAILLAEMLGWYDEAVREAAWGESYFKPEEISYSKERYPLLIGSIRNHWGEEIATLLDRAWQSKELNQCPTFGEWLLALMDIEEISVSKKQKRASKPIIQAALPHVIISPPESEVNTEQVLAPYALKEGKSEQSHDAYLPFIYKQMEQAKQWEEHGDWERAIEIYRTVQKQVQPQHALAQDLWMIIAEVETRLQEKRLPEEETASQSAQQKLSAPQKTFGKKQLVIGTAIAILLVAGSGLMWANEKVKTQAVINMQMEQHAIKEKIEREARERLEKEALEHVEAIEKQQETVLQQERQAKLKAEQDAKAKAEQLKKEQMNQQQTKKIEPLVQTEKNKKDSSVKEGAQSKARAEQEARTKAEAHVQGKAKVEDKTKISTPKQRTPIPRERAGKWGFVELDSVASGSVNIVVDYQYDYALAFSEGLAVVKKNGKFGYVNTSGQVVIPLRYDWASSFQNGKATVKKDGENSIITPQGKEV
ncbi:hypothetical protein EEL30_21005 [Brevibacillus laterosporus]|uniref:WG repeat-containing protein n=1 Tax=Brevibacillus laterosporus TaxID=1465 RepID=A0A518VC27_BRELA|nr:hypothetical protein EEL30_21005 [Brevibacillus laterosporus]